MSRKNPFEILGITPHVFLDDDVLLKAYLNIQKDCHPDCFVGASQEEKNNAQQISEEINAAFKLLKNPLSRLQSLLAIEGIKDFENPPPALLMEIMAWREILEQDPTSNVLALREEIQKNYKKCEKHFLEKNWESLKQIYTRLQYLEKTIQGFQ